MASCCVVYSVYIICSRSCLHDITIRSLAIDINDGTFDPITVKEIRHVFVLKWCFGKSVESIQQSWAMHTNASLIWYERRALTVK